MFIIFLLLVSIIIMNMIVGLAISNITKIFVESGILRLRMTVELLKIIEDLMKSVENQCPCLLKGVAIIPQLRKPSTLKQRQSFNALEIEKKVYVCPNHINQNRNIRIEDEGQEIVLNAILPPWIIENVFKIKQKITSSSKSSTLFGTSKNQESVQYLKMKNEIEGLKKELNVLSGKLKRNKS